MTNDYSQEDLDGRLMAIAINSLREARVAYGRDDRQWFDDDAKRVQMFYKLLHIVAADSMEAIAQGLPLTPEAQPKSPDFILKLSEVFDAADLDELPKPIDLDEAA